MVSPLARHLTRFTTEIPGAILAPVPAVAEPQVTLAVADLETRLHQARGHARAEALAEADRTIAQLTSDHQLAIDTAVVAARAEWIAAQAATLEASCRAAFDELRDLLCSRVTNVLRPILAEAVTARVLASLSDAMDRLAADPSHPVVTIRGPSDLISALRAGRTESAGVLYEDAETIEIKLLAEGSQVETRLGAALAMLRAPQAEEIGE